jgi:hypothetical protein
MESLKYIGTLKKLISKTTFTMQVYFAEIIRKTGLILKQILFNGFPIIIFNKKIFQFMVFQKILDKLSR